MTGELRLERYDAGTVAAIYPELVQLYTDTHRDLAADPFYSIKRFEAYFAKQRAHAGFELVTARTLGRLVGVIFGFSELGGEQFGLCELMVSPNYQRRGIAKRLHDELLRRRPERRADLYVRKDNAPAQAAYKTRGWAAYGAIRSRRLVKIPPVLGADP